MLGACSLTATGEVGHDPPDIYDKVRRADIQPRFPQPVQDVSSSVAAAQQPQIYYGDTKAAPVEGTGNVTPIALGAPPAPGEGYALNFENAPVAGVAKVVLGDILGVGYSIDPRVQGTISLASGHPVSKNDILFVLESALRTANVALIRDTSGYRLIPAVDAVGSGGVDRVAVGRPEPGYGITVVPLQYVSVQTVAKLLDSFVTKPGAIRADSARNMLVIVGNGSERRAALETVLSFDADWMGGQSVGIYPVHNSTPEPLISELEKIVDSGEGGLSQNMIKFQAVGRLNGIMVVTRKPELLKTAATWINRLDRSDTAGTGVKVYRVRYGDARQMARLLTDMFVGSTSSGLDSPTNQLAPDSGVTTMSSSPTPAATPGNAGPGTMSVADRLTGGGQSSLAGSGARQPLGESIASNTNSGANALAGNGARNGGTGGPLLPGIRC
jgi:general secretion pathway protein D